MASGVSAPWAGVDTPVSAPRSGAARSALLPAQREKNGDFGGGLTQKKAQTWRCKFSTVRILTDPQTDTRGLSDYNCMGLWPACKPSCPAAAVPMRVLRGRGAAGKLCVRACGPEEPNSIRIRIQLAARSSTTSGVVPLPLIGRRTCACVGNVVSNVVSVMLAPHAATQGQT